MNYRQLRGLCDLDPGLGLGLIMVLVFVLIPYLHLPW